MSFARGLATTRHHNLRPVPGSGSSGRAFRQGEQREGLLATSPPLPPFPLKSSPASILFRSCFDAPSSPGSRLPFSPFLTDLLNAAYSHRPFDLNAVATLSAVFPPSSRGSAAKDALVGFPVFFP